MLDERRFGRLPDLQADAVEAADGRAHGGTVGPPFLEAVLHPHARAYYRGADICTLPAPNTSAVDGRTEQSPRAAPDGHTDGLPELGQLQPFFAASLCDFG